MVPHSPTSKLAVSLSTKPWLKNQNQASKHTKMPAFHLRPAGILGLGEDLCLSKWQIFTPAAPCGASLLINLQSSRFNQTDVCTNLNSRTGVLGATPLTSGIWFCHCIKLASTSLTRRLQEWVRESLWQHLSWGRGSGFMILVSHPRLHHYWTWFTAQEAEERIGKVINCLQITRK